MMFSLAFSVGIRLNAWNTKPRCSRRTRVSWRSLRRAELDVTDEHLAGGQRVEPGEAVQSVLLPLPDGPITAVKRPSGIATSTPSRARTVVEPEP